MLRDAQVDPSECVKAVADALTKENMHSEVSAMVQLMTSSNEKLVLEKIPSTNFTGDETTAQGNNLLHLAAMHDFPNVVKAFLRRGAHVNARGAGNATALHFAVLRRAPQIVTELLLHGADPDLQTDKGMTPLNFLVAPRMHGDHDTIGMALQLSRVTKPAAWIAEALPGDPVLMQNLHVSMAVTTNLLLEYTGKYELVNSLLTDDDVELMRTANSLVKKGISH